MASLDAPLECTSQPLIGYEKVRLPLSECTLFVCGDFYIYKYIYIYLVVRHKYVCIGLYKRGSVRSRICVWPLSRYRQSARWTVVARALSLSLSLCVRLDVARCCIGKGQHSARSTGCRGRIIVIIIIRGVGWIGVGWSR